MNMYDSKAGTHGTGPFWRNLRAIVRRWMDRERELVSLRNAVGMMAEARRSDAQEWHEMYELNREMRYDAERFRWLTADHDSADTRERVKAICESIPTRGIDGVRVDIDARKDEAIPY